MANPTTNFGWVMPTSSSLVTNLPADFNTFGQAVDTSMSELLGGTTGQVLSKTSNTSMDFTWVTPTDQTPLTTKGDLFTFTTVDARLAVGSNGETLVADSSTATGLKWAAPAAAGMTNPMTTTGDIIYASSGSTPARLGIGSSGQVLNVSGGVPAWATPASGGGMTLLASGTLSGTTVSLTSISGLYNDLYIVIRNFKPVNANYPMYVYFNADTNNRYTADFASVSTSNTSFSENKIRISSSTSITANQGLITCEIPDYANTVTWKMLWSDSIINNNTTNTNVNYARYWGAYNQTSAISSIQLVTEASGFTSGNYYLYGVK